MERKTRAVRKKDDTQESKPFNKNFYGKKVESNVGVNKNKAAKKWQPNDDLNDTSGIDFNKFSDKKDTFSKAKEKPAFKSKEYSKDSKSERTFSKGKAFDASEKPSYKQRSRFEDKTSSKKEAFVPSNFSNDEDEFKSDFKRKSIFDKPADKSKPSYKKEYKPKFKSESKGPSKPRVTKDPDDDSIRLNKFISNAGICSRREADDLIKAGAVTVNGKVITEMGYKIKRTDLVNYGGQGLKPERQVYILLNKPKDYITTSEDPQERRTVLELIKGACKERVYPVGRLDRNTTGLLLLTNDGELTDKITHPSFKQKKIYHVELDKPVKKEHLKAIADGIELEDGLIKVDEIKYVEDSESKKEIGVTLHSGRNRIVRRIFEHFEYKVKKLDRVYFAGLTKKDLARGRWRFLTPMEINMLKMVK